MSKIVFITNSIGFGGAEKMLFFVANQMGLRGHDCLILNLNAVGDYVNANTRQAGDRVQVVTLPPPSGNRHADRVRQIVRQTRQFGGQLLVAFTEYPNLYARVAGMLLHIPSVMSERGDPTRTRGSGIRSRISRWLIGTSRGGVFQTEGARALYGRGLRRRGTVIPNPIFVSGNVPAVPFGQREKTVVSLGRLDNGQKRYDVMLEAFRIFHRAHPEYRLKLYGLGPDEQQIRDWAAQMQLPVDFMGLSRNSMGDMAPCGMFLITSDYEGISNSLLEAMAVGLPCVSTDHSPGGARLLIDSGRNGLLAPVGDSRKLAEAMCRFADDPDLAARCGRQAKEVLTRFRPEDMADRWEQYFLSLLSAESRTKG